MKNLLLLATASSALLLSACETERKETVTETKTEVKVEETATSSEPTIQEAKEFLENSEKEIVEINAEAARIYWINANFITDDTDWLASKIGAEGSLLSTRLANEAKRFNGLSLPADMERKMDGLKRGSSFPAPDKDGAAEQLSEIMTQLNSAYGKGKFSYKSEDPQFASFYEDNPDNELSLGQLSDIIAKSRDPEELSAV